MNCITTNVTCQVTNDNTYVVAINLPKEKGLSQSKLAEMVDVSRTHMSRIETADCAVSLDVVFAICDALCIKPAKLFDFRD